MSEIFFLAETIFHYTHSSFRCPKATLAVLELQVGTVKESAFGMVLNTSAQTKVQHHCKNKSQDISDGYEVGLGMMHNF
jgi:hypothetical protein